VYTKEAPSPAASIPCLKGKLEEPEEQKLVLITIRIPPALLDKKAEEE
jgi:hypothetical protein